MTYYNGNPYIGPTQTAPLDKFAHDECLPDDQFVTMLLPDFTQPYTSQNGNVTWVLIAERQQKWPWRWEPVYGSPEPCCICGKPVK